MECAESLTLLSEFHDRSLDDTLQSQVQSHLAECPPCANIFGELGEIVSVAVTLNTQQVLDLPDEDVFWQRLRIAEQKIH
jgi:predicted anti-sigma-YlaC factor YlaD